MDKICSDILIVGGGAAGMSAALSASAKDGMGITIVDDNPMLGGQIWRAELGKTKAADARKLIDEIDNGRVKIVNNAQVFASAEVITACWQKRQKAPLNSNLESSSLPLGHVRDFCRSRVGHCQMFLAPEGCRLW